MRVLDLFSGIGGFSLGLESVGMETVAFCEMDAFCQKVLKKHWPNVPIHSDIKELDGHEYRGAVELICGGFPCQPFSVAGEQRGAEDDRALWPEMFRIIKESKPKWVIGENVSGFTKMALQDVSLDLEREGYAVWAFLLPACAVDALHRRDRCYFVANQEDVAHSLRERSQGGLHRRSDEERKGELGHTRCSGPTYRQSRQKIWLPEPPVCRVANGVPDRTHRLKSLGNAVVPPLVAEIGRIVMYHQENGLDPR